MQNAERKPQEEEAQTACHPSVQAPPAAFRQSSVAGPRGRAQGDAGQEVCRQLSEKAGMANQQKLARTVTPDISKEHEAVKGPQGITS